MANGFTTNLNLTKPEVGADTDAWGGHTNSNWDILDALLAPSGSGSALIGANFSAGLIKTGQFTELLYAPAAGSAFTVALSDGSIQKFTTNANCTITLPASVAGKSYVIWVKYGGAHTLTFAGGTTIRWHANVTPTPTSLNGKVDVYSFTCDGTITIGSQTHAGVTY